MELLKLWNIEGQEVHEIQKEVWLIDQTYILKAYDNEAECRKNLMIYDSLRHYDIPIPELIPTKQGEAFATANQVFYLLTRRLSGNHLTKEEVFASPELAYKIGKTVGRLHRAFADITGQIEVTDNNFIHEMKGWIKRNLQEHATDSFTYGIIDACTEELAAVYDQLERHLIHRDMHLGNLLFEGKELTGYIDFDLSQINARIFDIAYLCAGWAVGQVGDAAYMGSWKQALQVILSGYQEEQPLSVTERNSLGIMMCCIEILFVAYFSSSKDTANSAKAEECLRWLWENRKSHTEKE